MQGTSNQGGAAAERLAERVEREGPVLKLETGGVGVFCPEPVSYTHLRAHET